MRYFLVGDLMLSNCSHFLFNLIVDDTYLKQKPPVKKKIIKNNKKCLDSILSIYYVGIMKPNEKYAKEIREIRKAAGMTQSEVADIVGVSFQTIARYEQFGPVKFGVYSAIIDACKKRIAFNNERFLK